MIEKAPKLLDLFCCAGGAGMGYHRAGFKVTGIDNERQPRYPFDFIQADALEYLASYGHLFDAIHASPPCQGYSRLKTLPWLKDKEYPMLIEPARKLLDEIGKPYIIENVENAPLDGFILCGRMFELPCFRHRLFETSFFMLTPKHFPHREVIGRGRMVNDRAKGTLNAGSTNGAFGRSELVTVAGHQYKKKDGERALGIDWMIRDELSQAIPPAYTHFIGRHLMKVVLANAA